MKILITGGAGFIASHIADAYIKEGHSVHILDNLETGSRKNLNPKAIFHKADIRKTADVERVFAKVKPEVVNHHAAIVSVVESLRDPIPTLQTNVVGTANVLAAFGKYGQGKNKKFIFASTGGALYGEPKKIPADETTPIAPLSMYGLSKYLAEQEIAFYARTFGFSYCILRYTNVYGPRQNPHGEAGVVAIFGLLMKQGKQPIIFGDGKKSRDYLFIEDVVHANVIALNKGANIAVNLGWGNMITDQMIFNTIDEATGFKGRPKNAPHRKGEVFRISLNAARAKKLLGWTPRVPLYEGIKRTVVPTKTS